MVKAGRGAEKIPAAYGVCCGEEERSGAWLLLISYRPALWRARPARRRAAGARVSAGLASRRAFRARRRPGWPLLRRRRDGRAGAWPNSRSRCAVCFASRRGRRRARYISTLSCGATRHGWMPVQPPRGGRWRPRPGGCPDGCGCRGQHPWGCGRRRARPVSGTSRFAR